MHFTKLALPLVSLLSFTAATPTARGSRDTSKDWSRGSTNNNNNVPQEYYDLGCPTNTTKPIASWKEQIDALVDFAHKLYIEQQVYLAFDTYVAVDYINHAPEVNGSGRDVAASFLAASLPGGNVTIARQFVGYNESGASFGTTHFKGYNPGLGYGAIMYIQRMIGTCIVEGWDVATGIEPSANPIAYF